jgi:hypothetical protein
MALIDALADSFVPSIATTPTEASPARAHTRAPRRTPRPAVAHAAAKLGDRRVIRSQLAGHDAIGDVLDAGTLDPARGTVAARVRVEQQRDQHRRLVRRPPAPVVAVVRIDRRQIQLGDRVEHRPHQMPLRHPIAKRRRHQKHLDSVTPDEPRTHADKAPEPSGRITRRPQPKAEATVLCEALSQAIRLTHRRRFSSHTAMAAPA